MNLPNFKQPNLKQKLILFPLILSLIYFIIINFIFVPSIRAITLLKSDIINQKIDLENKIIKERNMNKVGTKIEEIEPQIEKFDKIFINQNRELEFITVLENIAEKNQLNQKINLLTSSAKTSQTYKTIPINIEVNGNLNNFISYLTDLESLGYYVNITTMQIDTQQQLRLTNTNTDNSIGNANIKIQADTYWK